MEATPARLNLRQARAWPARPPPRPPPAARGARRPAAAARPALLRQAPAGGEHRCGSRLGHARSGTSGISGNLSTQAGGIGSCHGSAGYRPQTTAEHSLSHIPQLSSAGECQARAAASQACFSAPPESAALRCRGCSADPCIAGVFTLSGERENWSGADTFGLRSACSGGGGSRRRTPMPAPLRLAALRAARLATGGGPGGSGDGFTAGRQRRAAAVSSNEGIQPQIH